MINSLTGAGITMVPFKGGAPGITALLGGHVEGGAFSLGALSSHVKGGALRGVLVSNAFPGFDVPTLTQLGHRQNLLGVWFAFFAPAGVPPEVTKTLVAAIEKAAKDPAIAAKLVSFGILQDWAPPEKARGRDPRGVSDGRGARQESRTGEVSGHAARPGQRTLLAGRSRSSSRSTESRSSSAVSVAPGRASFRSGAPSCSACSPSC
jgi:hypothetical protein